jgi:four helix bundle protein
MQNDLKARTKALALSIIRLYGTLPKAMEAQVIGKQILRSGTSVGAQYREAHRSRSDAEFISKIEGALQELDETTYWLELLIEASVVQEESLTELLREADELTAIFVASVKRVKSRIGR